MPVQELTRAGASVRIFDDAFSACLAASLEIVRTIDQARTLRGKAVLGLATGHTPLPVYAHLCRLHYEHKVSFADVSTYNLDEYYPIAGHDPNSYRVYMARRLFDEVKLPANRVHLFDGTVPEAFADRHAADYDAWIEAEGGLDLQLLGIGRNGHVGFNEPSDLAVADALKLKSRVTRLHPITKQDAAVDFGTVEAVPDRAFTLGIQPILAARSILVLAFGAKKAAIVAKSLAEPMTAQVPGTLLQAAGSRVLWMLDQASASELV